MRLNRIYINQTIETEHVLELPSEAVRHLVTVLKMREGDELLLFNGNGCQYLAEIATVAKKRVTVHVKKKKT